MYANYRGRCIGRLLHFLCEYRIPGYDQMIFDGMVNITLWGKLFAHYTWDGESDVPTFQFFGEHKDLWSAAQTREKSNVLARQTVYDKLFSSKEST